MGVSDLQDSIRTSTGGIDYVSIYRSGVRSGVQNLLGILSDIDRWNEDGMKSRLLLLQDAQADAQKLSVPIMWIHGNYDAFVNEKRVRSILSLVQGEKYLVSVPYGHVPTKSEEAIRAFIPAIRFLFKANGSTNPVLAVPNDNKLAVNSKTEWDRAPRTRLASLQEFWRGYMLGTTEGSLGFDVLSMTRGYQEMMKLQVALLDINSSETLHDLGGAMGHVLSYLADTAENTPPKVHFYDFVPQLVEISKKRAEILGIDVTTYHWDAESADRMDLFTSAKFLLMSMFLSCLQDPLGFLHRLARHLPAGARIVASTIRPDADLSTEYSDLFDDIATGQIEAPYGYEKKQFQQAVRDYLNSAAWLMRLTEEGTFHLFEEDEFVKLFEASGFTVNKVIKTFGAPPRAIVLEAEKPIKS